MGSRMPPPATNGPVIAGYFANWGIYDRKFNVVDLIPNAHKLTHILYAFADMKPDGEVVVTDKFADIEKHFPQEQTVNGVADSWNDGGNNLYGNFKQFYLLKQRNRQLKVSLSIGGYTLSKAFPAIAADPNKRRRFVESSVKLVADFGLDGIDIDWEFPNDDKEAFDYVHLLYEVRLGLDAYQQQCQQLHTPRLLLTVAVPCGPEHYRKLRLGQMEPYVDLFYLMAYDYCGSWDAVTGHQSGLFGGKLNTNQAVSDFMAAGVPPNKIVMGMPLYGRGFCNTDGPGCRYQGVCKGSWEQGQYDYKHLPQPGAQEHNDMQCVASYSYDPVKKEYVTYDSPEVVNAKCRYIADRQLAGAMFWELSADHPPNTPRSLIQTVYNAFGGRLDQIPNHLEFPMSQYENIRRQMQ